MEIRLCVEKHTSSTCTPASTSLDALERVEAHNMYTIDKNSSHSPNF
jgi:hypothetical protein